MKSFLRICVMISIGFSNVHGMYKNYEPLQTACLALKPVKWLELFTLPMQMVRILILLLSILHWHSSKKGLTELDPSSDSCRFGFSELRFLIPVKNFRFTWWWPISISTYRSDWTTTDQFNTLRLYDLKKIFKSLVFITSRNIDRFFLWGVFRVETY